MISFINKSILNENKKVDLKGLNHNQVFWHLAELHHCDSFISNLNENYTMPKHIHYMSIAEGTDFDALLVNDKMFRYTKLSEQDRNDIQEYLNKYAYATALVKLNECSSVIGSGLNHVYNKDEVYNFLSESYDKLLNNISITREKGKLVESFNSNMEVYEGISNYIKGSNGKRIVENWKDTFSHSKVNHYQVLSEKQNGNDAIVRFIDSDGAILEACYINTKANIIHPGLNLNRILKRHNLKESYRIGTLDEYNQPFTQKYAVITSYNVNGNNLEVNVRDAFGNSGRLVLELNIPVEDFLNSYKDDLDEITKADTFGEGLDLTTDFFLDAANDIKTVSRLKNKIFTPKNNENQFLSYKVADFTPVAEGGRNIIVINDKEHFSITAVDKDGNEYSIKYLYTGEQPIKDAVADIEAEADEYDFSIKSDVVSFYQLLDDYGNPLKSYPLGIKTKERNVGRRKKVVEEAEGVQTTDIAPKLDQGQLITVRMKKRKPITESFKINTLSEKDAFYGSRGFLKDENGRYHFGDYYITESGKVVHKSKLNEMDRLFKDVAGKYGIKSYFDMVYGQEPKSEYDKLIQQYMNEHDSIREKMIAIENEWNSKKDDREHYKEAYAKYKAGKEECREELSKLSELLDKAEKIPEEERGENWKDYKEIQKDDDDYFAQTMGYKDSEEAEKKGWGFSKLHESVLDLADKDIINQLRSSKVYSKEGLVQSYIRALRQKEALQQTGKLTDEVAKAIDNEIQSLIDKSKEEPKPVEKPKVIHKHEEPKEYDSEDLPMDASPEEIDDYYSDLYYNKTQEETDPQKKFEYACYTAAAQWMSSVTEETSRDFIEDAILPVAKNAYYNSDYTDEDYMNEIIFNLQNERGIRFNFNKDE